MPEVGRHKGIVFYIKPRNEHNPPHVHAKYAGAEASYRINNGTRLAGKLPPQQDKDAQWWVSNNQAKLEQEWKKWTGK